LLLKQLKKNPIFKFLASLKLAVILLVALAVILAVATFYESLYDTKTAQHLVYKSPLFALFLSFIGINLTCSAIMRFPWKKSQTGFVVTHLGIIIILLGSLVTMYKGVDGSVALEEGEIASRVMIDEPVLYFGRSLTTLVEIPAEYRWNPPEPEKTLYSYPLSGEEDMVATIDDYYHHAKSETLYVMSDTGMPAAELRLSNENVDQKLWLTPALGQVSLGPATLAFSRLPDKTAEDKFREGASESSRGIVQLLVEDNPQVVDLDRLTPNQPFPLEYEGATLELLRYLPHATIVDNELVSKSPQPHNPAVELVLKTPKASQTWLLFSKLPELNTRVASSGDNFQASLIYSREEATDQRSLELGLTASGQLLCRIDGKKVVPIREGDSIDTGWMNLKAELVSYLPVARQEKLVTEVIPKKGKEDKAPGPAIRLTLDQVNQGQPLWLERGDIRKLMDDTGRELYIGYGYKSVTLPFKIELKDFRIGFDPGTQTAATYESDILVGESLHTVAMNEPYEQDGYKVFQASFSKTASGGDVSVFSIAKDPGIELKYFGSILMVLGIIIMFYFKPKKTRREETPESGANPS
jgi:ResB-like family